MVLRGRTGKKRVLTGNFSLETLTDIHKLNKESPLTTHIYFNFLLYGKIKDVLGTLK